MTAAGEIVYLPAAGMVTKPLDTGRFVSCVSSFENENGLLERYEKNHDGEIADAVRHLYHLKEKAIFNRVNALSQIRDANSGHPGGSLSETEILLALYEVVMRHQPQNPGWSGRDRFVLSKGHATPGLYAQLAMSGYFDSSLLRAFRKNGGYLPGHSKLGVAGVEASTGALGTGISIGNGMAYVMKREMPDATVFVLVGDGELQEGQIWEAAMTTSHYSLGNVVVIVDNNGVQNDYETEKTKNVHPIGEKFRACGWEVIGRGMRWHERTGLYRNGHDIVYIMNALNKARETGRREGVPVAVIADTDKGRGISYMVGKGEWHGKAPDDALYSKALQELFENLGEVRRAYAEIQ